MRVPIRSSYPLLSATLLLTLATASPTRMPRPELAGLRLGMTEEAAHESLEKRGTKSQEKLQEGEADEQESWSLQRGPWGYVAFGVEDERVSWVTAFARRDGPRIRYRDLGSLARSQRTGNYFVTWKVPATRGARAYSLIARGGDSIYVASVSLVGTSRETVRDHPADRDSAR